MRVGVISDTHGRVHPSIATHFRGVDAILHAGDIGGVAILEELRAIAPVTAVAGNIDGFRCGDATEFAVFRDGPSPIVLVHILEHPKRIRPEVADQIEAAGAKTVVFGHSHLPHDEVVDGILYFNPASAGPRRFAYPVSIGMLDWAGDHWAGRHIALDDRSEAALQKTMNQITRARSG